jgi:hypothetical protein
VDDCPPDAAAGCICIDDALGDEGFCVPACTSDADCPEGLECNSEFGACEPSGAPPPE